MRAGFPRQRARRVTWIHAVALVGGGLAFLFLPGVQADVFWGVGLGGTGEVGHGSLNPGIAVTNPGSTALTATVTTSTGTVATLTVPPGGTQTYTVPVASPTTAYQGALGTYKVETSAPAMVAQFTPIDVAGEGDATRLLAESELGNNHRVLAFSSSAAKPSYVTIVATQPATTVYFTPSVNAIGPGSTNLNAGVTASFTLSAHDQLQIRSATADRLTGSEVTSNLPVAVFSGSVSAVLGTSAPDRINHQMPPVHALGQDYVACATQLYRNTGFDRIEIVAVAGPTTVTYQLGSGLTGTLNLAAAGAWQDIDVTDDIHLSSNASILVGHYFGKNSGFPGVEEGDPSLFVLTPMPSTDGQHRFYSAPGWNSRVQVAAPASATVSLDSNAIVDWRPVGSSGYKCASLATATGTHGVSASAGVDVSVLGTGGGVSYWYSSSGVAPAPLACSASPALVQPGAAVTWTATGGSGIPKWSAPGGTPSQGTGGNFSTTYATGGSKTATVIGAGVATCTVEVAWPTLSCAASPATAPVGSNFTAVAEGGSGSYAWTTSGIPGTGQGSTHVTRFATAGTHSITVTGGGTATCSVTVVDHACQGPVKGQTGEVQQFLVPGADGPYSWTTSGFPDVGSGAGFATVFYAAGHKVVSVTFGTQTATCVIEVEGKSIQYLWTGTAAPYPDTAEATSSRSNQFPIPHAFVVNKGCGLAFTLDATPSHDTDGLVTNWAWDLGDGTQAQGRVVDHEFALPGLYMVRLTVQDDVGHASQGLGLINARECAPIDEGEETYALRGPPPSCFLCERPKLASMPPYEGPRGGKR